LSYGSQSPSLPLPWLFYTFGPFEVSANPTVAPPDGCRASQAHRQTGEQRIRVQFGLIMADKELFAVTFHIKGPQSAGFSGHRARFSTSGEILAVDYMVRTYGILNNPARHGIL